MAYLHEMFDSQTGRLKQTGSPQGLYFSKNQYIHFRECWFWKIRHWNNIDGIKAQRQYIAFLTKFHLVGLSWDLKQGLRLRSSPRLHFRSGPPQGASALPPISYMRQEAKLVCRFSSLPVSGIFKCISDDIEKWLSVSLKTD